MQPGILPGLLIAGISVADDTHTRVIRQYTL